MAKKKPIISSLGQWAYPGEVTVIPSNQITMKGVNYPVLGIDNLGNQQVMMPGMDYTFPGDYVTEIPEMGKGGLTQWFAEKWVDVKTGKPCGRSGKDKDGRPYPACRPSKRVNETTPKTTSEMSSKEKAKFKREKTSGKRIDYNHKRREFGGENWLDQYQSGGNIKNISDSPNYQYDDKGNLLYTPNIRIEPYASDNSTRGSFSVNPKLIMQNLNPTLEEFIDVASPYYPIDNKLVNSPKINLQPSNYQQYLEQEYVLPQMINKSFGNLPLIKDDGYSPNRRWVSNLRAKDTGSKYSNDSYAYVLRTNPNNLVDYSTKNTIEDVLSSNDKVFYDYLAKNNYLPNTVSQLTKKLPDQIWNTAEQMRVEMLNNPEIMSWANLHNVDLGYKQKGQGDDSFAPKIPESIYANRLVKAGLSTNRPDYDYKPMETYIVQDPSKFNLAGYFPMNSIVKNAEQKVLNKKESEEPKQESIYFGTPEYFEKESYIKNEIAKRLGINPSVFDTGEYLIHYNQSPITEYTPGKKYGGWLEKYQKGGFSYTPPSRRAFTTSYQEPVRSTSDNTRVVTPNTNVSDATRAMIADQRAREAAAKRSGVIYAGTPESNYEKAKKAASFVEQEKERTGSASPMSYVLDVVNPATYAFAATDLVGNTGSAIKNVAQGNFQEAGSDLLNAGMNVLYLLPAVSPAKSAARFATTQTPLKNAYKINPWAFKPNPEAYYHRSPNIENIINQEKGILQGFGESKAGAAYNEFVNTFPGINLKKAANNQLYFSKGVPLDYGRYNPETFNSAGKLIMTGQGYRGPYLVQVEGVPMGLSTKGSLPGKEPIGLESYAVSKRPISLDEAKFYKEDWLRGYKPIQISDMQPSASLSNLNKTDIRYLSRELLGEALSGNKNRQAIAEGNAWLKNWIDDPITQAKIDTDLGWIPERNNILKDQFSLGYEQAKSFTPLSKEYPFSEQFKDLFVRNQPHIHSGNSGVSYLHRRDPYSRSIGEMFSNPKLNSSWISRNLSMSKPMRRSTTIHEGTHDWTSDFLLRESGQLDDIKKLYPDKIKEINKNWQSLRDQGINPSTVMGTENANLGYLADPTEVHARVMELRQLLGMTPEQSVMVTPEKAADIIRIIQKPENAKFIDPKFLDVIESDPKKLASLFNRLWATAPIGIGAAGVAQLPEQKNGGWLNKYK